MGYYKCKYFKIQELVSKQVYQKYGDFCWSFFDPALLRDLDTIREYHNSPITINNWHINGQLQQCGLRCNKDPLVVAKSGIYCSGHTMGKAFDLHSSNIKKLYKDVEFLFSIGKLQVVRRIESAESTKYQWMHLDCLQSKDATKLEVFKD